MRPLNSGPMRMRVLTAGLLIGLATGATAAEPPAIGAVPAIVASSEMIVVGRAIGQQWNDPAHGAAGFIVSVDRVLKGPRLALLRIRSGPSDPAAGGVREGEPLMFFLRRVGSRGSYAAVDPVNPVLPAPPRAGIERPAGTGPLFRVAAELARFFAFRPPSGADDDRYEMAADALKTIPYPVAEGPLHALLRSRLVLARIWAENCLMSFGDAGDLGELTPVLLNPPAGISFSISMFAAAMKGAVRSPSAIPVLAELLSSRNLEIRRAAAYALRDIATPDVVDPLGAIALKDRDEEVRYYAVSGLAAATGAAEVPGLAAFGEHRQRHTEFWAHWLATHGPR